MAKSPPACCGLRAHWTPYLKTSFLGFLTFWLLLATASQADLPYEKENIFDLKRNGFSRQVNRFEEAGFDFVEIYPELEYTVTFKKKVKYVGFFICKVHEVGNYFDEFIQYYDRQPEKRKQRLRKAILAEEKLDFYLADMRNKLENGRRSGSDEILIKMTNGFLLTIEEFIVRLRAEESSNLPRD